MRQDNRTAHEMKKKRGKEHKKTIYVCIYVNVFVLVFFYEAAELVAACLAA
jgi:hypothetical protein